MINFYSFHPIHKEFSTFVDLADHQKLPSDLIDALNLKKETSYDKGFVSIVNPSRYRDLFILWNLSPSSCYPFLKFAFGAFVFFHENQFKMLNPVFNSIDVIGKKDEFGFVMNTLLCDQLVLNNSLFMDIYFDSKNNIGAPDLNECYTFIPPLRLGGSIDKGNVKRVKIKEQLMILSQI